MNEKITLEYLRVLGANDDILAWFAERFPTGSTVAELEAALQQDGERGARWLGWLAWNMPIGMPKAEKEDRMSDTPKFPAPRSPGFWWACTGGSTWHNAIVEVSGHPPFLRLRCWDVASGGLHDLDSCHVNAWGPRIVHPDTETGKGG